MISTRKFRREEAHLVELLLQYQANPHLREQGQELPIIVAASSEALSCVKILLAYGADPGATEYLPSAEHPGQMFSIVRRKTAMDVAAPFPEIVEVLQTALSTICTTDKDSAEVPGGPIICRSHQYVIKLVECQ